MTDTKYDESVRIVRRESRDYMLQLLKKKALTSKEIVQETKKKFPDLCDDKIKCICDGSSRVTGEWKHQILWAIQDNKYTQKIKYDKKTHQYSLI